MSLTSHGVGDNRWLLKQSPLLSPSLWNCWLMKCGFLQELRKPWKHLMTECDACAESPTALKKQTEQMETLWLHTALIQTPGVVRCSLEMENAHYGLKKVVSSYCITGRSRIVHFTFLIGNFLFWWGMGGNEQLNSTSSIAVHGRVSHCSIPAITQRMPVSKSDAL